MPIYEYLCVNDQCTQKEVFEKLCKIADRNKQVCKECKEPAKLKPSTNSGSHISWSLWQV